MMGSFDRFWLVLAACFIPAIWLVADIAGERLGANPIQGLHIRLGDLSLRFLLVTLAVTPLQMLTGVGGMARYRQMFGLMAFFYATLHVLGYLVVDHAGDWRLIAMDIWESRYIWLGVAAYLILLMLAVTSPKKAKIRLGKSWKKLHRLIYPCALAASFHYLWQFKGDMAEPLFYLAALLLLLGFRLLPKAKRKSVAAAFSSASSEKS
ncbi:sulfite oxidase heme-binding subunit YedZ [Methylogaea oryzae]|uniref:Protein-methionine-sulfoxide reductase heme-binding subunit MsrQ n=1 Tax=Methylogaea oryzae TaxID=1295382 RepID=A0A8D4VN25_9GAMM|nr:protein-methionine-sulfoxide reductase heme-binding subunit MsrQ [Methylogaea oryzae]BBL70895.1 protein-methionine-sulfoxide reductase heme-binding subunit MsrQ [Methylogaea oryzae]